jgi:hypothetical protein
LGVSELHYDRPNLPHFASQNSLSSPRQYEEVEPSNEGNFFSIAETTHPLTYISWICGMNEQDAIVEKKKESRKEKKTLPRNQLLPKHQSQSDTEKGSEEAGNAIKLPGKHKQKQQDTSPPPNELLPEHQSRSGSEQEAQEAGAAVKSSKKQWKQTKKQLPLKKHPFYLDIEKKVEEAKAALPTIETTEQYRAFIKELAPDYNKNRYIISALTLRSDLDQFLAKAARVKQISDDHQRENQVWRLIYIEDGKEKKKQKGDPGPAAPPAESA